MDLRLLSGILLLVASALAVFSVIKNRNSQKIIGRAEFIIFLLVAALPSIYLTVADIAFLSGSAERLPYTDLVLKIWFFWLAAIVYHFYQRVCWRINDAGLASYISFVCLVPYINVLIFIFLCVAPSKKRIRKA